VQHLEVLHQDDNLGEIKFVSSFLLFFRNLLASAFTEMCREREDFSVILQRDQDQKRQKKTATTCQMVLYNSQNKNKDKNWEVSLTVLSKE
jgi:hypothetical protein